VGRERGLQLTNRDGVIDISMANIATPHRKIRHAKQFSADNGSIRDRTLLDTSNVAMGAGLRVRG